MTFTFKLQQADGTPAEPPSLRSAVPNWRPGDTIPLGHRTLRVVGVRDEGADVRPRPRRRGRPSAALAVHHLDEVGLGGVELADPSRLLAVCGACHRKLHH